jgi:hypothetical protein
VPGSWAPTTCHCAGLPSVCERGRH